MARRNDPQLADNRRKFQAELKRFTDLNEVIWRRPCPTPACAGGARFRLRRFGFLPLRLAVVGGARRAQALEKKERAVVSTISMSQQASSPLREAEMAEEQRIIDPQFQVRSQRARACLSPTHAVL